MFISDQHQSQLLDGEWYRSPEHYDSEQRELFLPAWQCIAATSEIPNDGDFKTLKYAGRSLILRRENGEYRTFLNVCSHRYSTLTDEPHGCMPTLRCQYHGWEFDGDGNTRKIPDAPCFKPLAPGMLGLTRYRTEQCGQLIFMTLDQEACSLRDYLGENFDRIENWFHSGLMFVGQSIRNVPVNWKIIVENALESYHLSERHSKTFGNIPPAKQCTHTLGDGWSRFIVDFQEDRSLLLWLDACAHRWSGTEQDRMFEQIHSMPNMLFGRLSFHRWFETVIPVSPTETHHLGAAFVDLGQPASRRGKLLFPFLKRWATWWHETTNAEDRPVLLSTQSGLGSPELPRGGILSSREERLIHLQQHVLDRCGD